MPEEDQAKILTPAARRRRQRMAAFAFSLFLAGMLIALAATVLAVNNGRNFERLVRQVGLEDYLLAAPPALRIDRQPRQPPASRFPPWLLRAGLERMALFEKAAAFSAEERCNLLRTQKGTQPTFTTSDDDWECLIFEEFDNSSEPASFFIQARGGLPDTFRNFRLKFSLTNPLTETVVLNEAIAAMQRFDLPMAPETRAYLAQKLTARTEFTSTSENYWMAFRQEIIDKRRYNLVILPLPQTITCGDPALPPPDRAGRPIYGMTVGCLSLQAAPRQPPPASSPPSLFPAG